VLLYLNQEGRGIGISNKIQGVRPAGPGLRHRGANERLGFSRTSATTASARRSWATSACGRCACLTNNPRKFVGLEGYGLSVSETVSIEIPPSTPRAGTIKTKKDKLGHRLTKV